MTPPMARLAVLIILCSSAGRAVAETSVPTSSDAAPAAPAAPSPSAPSGAPAEPFAFADFTWLTGNARTKESHLSWGADTLGNPDRMRIHTDDSIQVKYLDRPESFLSKAAFSVTIDDVSTAAA